jgi:hypothetical protein
MAAAEPRVIVDSIFTPEAFVYSSLFFAAVAPLGKSTVNILFGPQPGKDAVKRGHGLIRSQMLRMHGSGGTVAKVKVWISVLGFPQRFFLGYDSK